MMLVFSVTACMEDAEVWDSSVKGLSGEWYVKYNVEGLDEDPFGAGYTTLLTFNTADDNGTEMWLTDVVNGTPNFWKYMVKVPVDMNNKTFGGEEIIKSVIDDYEIKIIVKNGIVVEDAMMLPSGTTADSIYYEIWFEDISDAGLPDEQFMQVSGYRKSGFQEDEH